VKNIIETKIHQLGGITPIGDAFLPVEEKEICALEKYLGVTLPEDYRDFVTSFGAAMFNECVEFQLLGAHPVYSVQSSPLPIPHYAKGPFAAFYGANEDPFRPLAKALKTYEGRMPDTLIPIGDDGGGNQICLGIKGDERGKIYYWDHHNEWDEDDYLEEHGESMPSELQFQNVYLIANSFEDFIVQLHTTNID
jgi:hypothetical protein